MGQLLQLHPRHRKAAQYAGGRRRPGSRSRRVAGSQGRGRRRFHEERGSRPGSGGQEKRRRGGAFWRHFRWGGASGSPAQIEKSLVPGCHQALCVPSRLPRASWPRVSWARRGWVSEPLHGSLGADGESPARRGSGAGYAWALGGVLSGLLSSSTGGWVRRGLPGPAAESRVHIAVQAGPGLPFGRAGRVRERRLLRAGLLQGCRRPSSLPRRLNVESELSS